MVFKKRQVVTSALVLALGAAVFVNWYYTKPRAQASTADVSVTEAAENLGDAQYVLSDVSGKEDPFAAARLKRERAHDTAIETLQEILRDSAATQAATTEASAALAKLTENMAAESDVETLIGAKTGLDSLVILDGKSAEVLLAQTPSESAVMLQITEIVVQKTGLEAEDVTIIEAS